MVFSQIGARTINKNAVFHTWITARVNKLVNAWQMFWQLTNALYVYINLSLVIWTSTLGQSHESKQTVAIYYNGNGSAHLQIIQHRIVIHMDMELAANCQLVKFHSIPDNCYIYIYCTESNRHSVVLMWDFDICTFINIECSFYA